MANCALIRFDPGQIRKLRGEHYGFVVFCAVLHVEQPTNRQSCWGFLDLRRSFPYWDLRVALRPARQSSVASRTNNTLPGYSLLLVLFERDVDHIINFSYRFLFGIYLMSKLTINQRRAFINRLGPLK